ncbi:hypothetical protein OG216_24795 [Streptomycetaceae bacterium NBC_01309]
MNSRRILSISAAAILGASLLSGTAVAETAKAPAGAKQHCLYGIADGKTTCFATYQEVLDFVADSGGSPTGRDRAATLASTLVGTLWGGYSAGSTPSYTMWNVNGGCGYAWANVSSTINDKASSITVTPGCRINLWQHSNIGGNFEVRYGGFGTLSLDNQISSWETFAA